MREPVAVARSVRRRFRRASRPIGIAVSCLLSCSVASAHSWQCHAPEGTFSSHDIAVPPTTTRLSGEMLIRRADGASRWQPMAKVAFIDAGRDADGCRCNGVVAAWSKGDPHHILVSLSVDGRETPVGPVPYGEPVRFTLTFTRSGFLTLTVGAKTVQGQSSAPIRNDILLDCSTADVVFDVADAADEEQRSPERCPFAAQEQWSADEVGRYCRAGR